MLIINWCNVLFCPYYVATVFSALDRVVSGENKVSWEDVLLFNIELSSDPNSSEVRLVEVTMRGAPPGVL